MATSVLARRLLFSSIGQMQKIQKRGNSLRHIREKIGCREEVGYGYNGLPTYVDRVDFPFPAIRWMEVDKRIESLRQKECGDWNEMSCAEKKMLYRASFRCTFAEMKSPTGEWKSIIGITLMWITVGFWLFIFLSQSCNRPRPHSFSQECKEAQLRRMIGLRVNPIDGLTSKWDYTRDNWKV